MSSQIQPYDFQGNTIRTTVDDNGNPLFCANDVAVTLGYKRPADAISAHCKGSVIRRPLETSGGIQQVRFISEGDMYRLIASSKLPAAQQFESWVFDTVVPSIRQTGSYSTDSTEVALAKALLTPKAVAGILTELDKTQNENRQLTARNAELEPKAKALDDFTNVTGTMSVAEAANQLTNAGAGNIGRDQLFQFMRSLGWVYRRDNTWAAMQSHINAGHLVMKEHRTHGEHRNGVPFAYAPTVRVTRAGLALLHRRWCERQFKAQLENQPTLSIND